MGTLDGRVALVTGGTRGIGAAISRTLARDGAHVAAGFHSDVEKAEKLAAELDGEGWSVSLHQGNVGQPDDCSRVANEVFEQYGHIDYLVNNAGVLVDKTVRNMSIQDWHAVLRVNLSGSFYMVKEVLEAMIDRGVGRIVNISSVIGSIGNIGQANYAASKSGMMGYSRSLAQEVARFGITVNCVSPGFTDTDMLGGISGPQLDGLLGRIPMRRLGTPEEVAHAVRFLVDDSSGYITGSVIDVNGGLSMD